MIDLYGARWNGSRLAVERELCRSGGYKTVKGKRIGNGYGFHFKALLTEIAPWFEWHCYSNAILEAWLAHQNVGVMGPTASGKTTTSALIAYGEFVVHPQGTSILMSSTHIDGLRLRIWGSVTEIIQKAKQRHPDIPGHVVDAALKIFANPPSDEEIRIGKNAIIGVACKKGEKWVGLGNYVGIHNQRVFLFADEASLMQRAFYDGISNMIGNAEFKCMIMGNPVPEMTALDIFCEPSKEIGGWEGLPDSRKTRTWMARGKDTVVVQLSGLDSPNIGHSSGLAPYRGILTGAQMEEIKDRYGEDSWHYQTMALGIRPKGIGNRRVITHALCDKYNAFGEPAWNEEPRKDYVGLDAAYSGTGGDRTALVRISTGKDIYGKSILAVVDGPHVLRIRDGARGADNKPLLQEYQISEWCMNYCKTNAVPPERFGLDSTGRGSLVGALAKEWSPSFQTVEFGGPPVPADRRARSDRPELESELYGKMVTALWMAARNLIECRQLRGLPTSIFEEGSYREWGEERGKEDVEPKDELRRRLGRSCDFFDALVVAIELARRDGFQIGTSQNDVKKPSGFAWLKGMQDNYRKLADKEVLA